MLLLYCIVNYFLPKTAVDSQFRLLYGHNACSANKEDCHCFSCCCNLEAMHTHTHTHSRLTALFPGLPGSAGTRKAKPIWILLKQETVSGSGISWAICKSAPRSRQVTTPAPHHSVFLQARCPSCRPTNSIKELKHPEAMPERNYPWRSITCGWHLLSLIWDYFMTFFYAPISSIVSSSWIMGYIHCRWSPFGSCRKQTLHASSR